MRSPRHGTRAHIDHPVLDLGVLAKSIPNRIKAGIDERKRSEARCLIQSGLPYDEVVKRSGMFSGTVSRIRREDASSNSDE